MPEPRARLIVGSLPEPGVRVRLDPSEAAHARARRVVRGDAVVLVDGSGRKASARIVAMTRDGVEVFVEKREERATPGPEVSLLVGGIRPERLTWLVEKATELEAARIALVGSARTQSFRASPSVITRLERVARAAAKQAEHAVWPEISGPHSFAETLGLFDSGERLFLDFEGEEFPGAIARRDAAILVGPEGGWTGGERREAVARGWRPTRLPAGKLRAETAAIAALVLLRAAMRRREP